MSIPAYEVTYGTGDFDPPAFTDDDLETVPEAPANSYLPATAFQIDSEDRANWLLRKLATIEAEQRRVKAQAEQMIADLKADYNRLWFLFGQQLEIWAREELQRRGNYRKTLRTLQGSLSFRTVQQMVRVMDAQVAMQYARQSAPACVVTTEKLDASAYKMEAERALQQTGEVLPGIEVQTEREAFRVSFGKAEE